MHDFLVSNFFLAFSIAIAPFLSFFGTLIVSIAYLSIGRPEYWGSPKGGCILLFSQLLLVQLIYPLPLLLLQQSLVFATEFISGWIVSIVANLVLGYVGSRAALALVRHVANRRS